MLLEGTSKKQFVSGRVANGRFKLFYAIVVGLGFGLLLWLTVAPRLGWPGAGSLVDRSELATPLVQTAPQPTALSGAPGGRTPELGAPKTAAPETGAPEIVLRGGGATETPATEVPATPTAARPAFGLDLRLWPVLLFWLVLTIVTDMTPVPLPGGGYITVASTLDYAGILILGPVATAWVEVVNTLILQLFVQKKPAYRALFNAANFGLTVLAAGAVYHALGGTTGRAPALPGDLLPLFAMGLTYFLMNTGIVSVVLSLTERKNVWRVWQVNFLWTIFHMLASLPVGVAIAVVHHSLSVWGVCLFVAPLLLARYSFKLYTDMKRDLFDFVRVLTGVIDEFDPYTRQHSLRVAGYAVQIARGMQLPEYEVESIEFAALLHDFGKIKHEHRELLLRPGALTPEEKRAMAEHAVSGAAMAAQIRSLRKISEIVLSHHEKFGGGGYPRGMSGTQIPLGARILNVADAFDAMTSDRVYRKALPVERALDELRRGAGTQFDPDVVVCFTRLIEQERAEAAPQPEPLPLTLSPVR